MWDDVVRDQFEVLDMHGARVLHGYLLTDKYVWFYSGTDYSGVVVALDKLSLCKAISLAIAKYSQEYGCSIRVSAGKTYNDIHIDAAGSGAFQGRLTHFTVILENIIPNE